MFDGSVEQTREAFDDRGCVGSVSPDPFAGADEIGAGRGELGGPAEVIADLGPHRPHHNLGPPAHEIEVGRERDITGAGFGHFHGHMAGIPTMTVDDPFFAEDSPYCATAL